MTYTDHDRWLYIQYRSLPATLYTFYTIMYMSTEYTKKNMTAVSCSFYRTLAKAGAPVGALRPPIRRWCTCFCTWSRLLMSRSDHIIRWWRRWRRCGEWRWTGGRMESVQTGVGEVPVYGEFPDWLPPSRCWRLSDWRYHPAGLDGREVSGRGQWVCICPNYP